MNTFNISLCISDYIYINNCKNLLEKQVIVTNSNDSICLKCDYLLNIIRVQNNFFTILLQNGFQTYIRNIYENETFQICLPCNNGTRIITICGVINR